MNLAGNRILVCGGRDFTDYPLLCGTLDGLFPALVLRPSEKSSFTARDPVPIGRCRTRATRRIHGSVSLGRRRRNAGPSPPGTEYPQTPDQPWTAKAWLRDDLDRAILPPELKAVRDLGTFGVQRDE
jgi:hypothetical protein